MSRAGEDPARVVLGEIIGAAGHQGTLRVRWLGDGPENLLRVPRVALGSDAGTVAGQSTERWYEIRSSQREGRGELRIELAGIESREAAMAVSGLLMIGAAGDLEKLPAGEHYWYEWIGCAVWSADGRALGAVQEIWDAGAHDVLVVREETSGRELLLPVVRALLREVDLDARRIVMEVPAGLEQPAARED